MFIFRLIWQAIRLTHLVAQIVVLDFIPNGSILQLIQYWPLFANTSNNPWKCHLKVKPNIYSELRKARFIIERNIIMSICYSKPLLQNASAFRSNFDSFFSIIDSRVIPFLKLNYIWLNEPNLWSFSLIFFISVPMHWSPSEINFLFWKTLGFSEHTS